MDLDNGLVKPAPDATPTEVARAIAWNIRVELVCCNAYERWAEDSVAAEDAGHGLCFWGEAAARLAEDCV